MSDSPASQQERASAFRALHEAPGAFVIPNPWDMGSAKMLTGLGFSALATTSAGFANTLGRNDGQVSLAEKVAHCAQLCAATHLPLSADLENGFGGAPDDVQRCLREIAAVGVVGGSIEDFSGNADDPIYAPSLALERIQAAVEAVAGLDCDFVLTARCENFLHGHQDLDDTIARLVSFAEAGADVLYAPGLTSLEQVQAVTQAVAKPVNVLVPFFPGVSIEQLAAAGAKRLSLGSALYNTSVQPLLQASEEMNSQGEFQWLKGMANPRRISELLQS